jgi:hypothetical protein
VTLAINKNSITTIVDLENLWLSKDVTPEEDFLAMEEQWFLLVF